jgi:hypothetical protein
MRVDELSFSTPPSRGRSLRLDKMVAAHIRSGLPRAPHPPIRRSIPSNARLPESWSKKWPGPISNHYTFNDNTVADAIDMMLGSADLQ